MVVSFKDALRVIKMNAVKKLGQNFLRDENYVEKVVKMANVEHCEVVDVACGPATISSKLVSAGARSIIGIDRDFKFSRVYEKFIMENNQIPIRFYTEDLFTANLYRRLDISEKLDWNHYATPKIRIIGNLPFNISLPLLLSWTYGAALRKGFFRIGRIPLYLSFQKEDLVAENYISATRMSVIVNAYFHITQQLFVPKTAFYPTPNVDAMFVELIPRMIPKVEVPFFVFRQVIKALFSVPNRTIKKNLEILFPTSKTALDKMISQLTFISLDERVRNLSEDDWMRISKLFYLICLEENLPLTPLKIKPIRPIPDPFEVISNYEFPPAFALQFPPKHVIEQLVQLEKKH